MLSNINEIFDYLTKILKTKQYSEITELDIDNIDIDSVINNNKEDVFNRNNESPDIAGKESIIIKCENDDKNKIFISFCVYFYILNKVHNDRLKEKLMIGLDFEFNERKIALIQLSFFRPIKSNVIFIMSPHKMSVNYTSIMTDTVFTSDVRRIVHGSDSLDIPYIFEELFEKDSNKIIQFTKNVTDTRYLCEYYKIINETGDKKCSIYDAMLYFNTINDDIYHNLTNINEVMGPVQDVNWDIDRMDTYHLRYAAYDVYFLQYFLTNIISKYHKNPGVQNRGNSIELIPPLTRLVYLEKYDIIKIIKLSKDTVDPMNNYYVRTKEGNMTLIKIYNKIIDTMFIESIKVKPSDILSINYFKSTLTYIFKRLVFYSVNRKYKVFINKNTKFTDRITLDDLYSELELVKSTRLNNLFKDFKQNVDDNLGSMFE